MRRYFTMSQPLPTSETFGAGWQYEHARRYLASDGEDGYIWEDMPTLLLTTTGRRSGKQHTTPLVYGEEGGRYIVVASRGGRPEHPQWYLNLLVEPEVGVQIWADRFRARARPATGDEKPALWKLMSTITPRFNTYQSRTGRQIPVVILERI
jgi:deazaflavin-dependent oxidoreductase (nitroreductase family)